MKEPAMTRIADVMTRGVRTLSPGDSMVMAAQAMEELNVGVVPVCDADRLVGMVTDRDIVLRGVAQGRPVETTRLEEVMSQDPCWCFEDQSVDEVVEQMRDAQIRRIPVVDSDRHLVGIVSLGDLAVKSDMARAGEALESISEPPEPDRSGQSQASGAAGGGSATGQVRRTQG
jgi:CBS domain-containing protein